MTELNHQRRIFLAKALKATTALAFVQLPINQKSSQSVQEIIDLILRDIKVTPSKTTVDTLKSGDPAQKVTGIISTMFATVDVINEAIRRKANFIIAHEPTFYNHLDNKEWVANNAVVKAKSDLLAQNKIAVWRFHDGWHDYVPDGILHGLLRSAGWFDYAQAEKKLVTLPENKTIGTIAQHLKTSLNISHLRVVGDLGQQCRKIAIIPGSAGGQAQVSMVETEKPDLLIVGESAEWETPEYIRDMRSMHAGRTALMILGHAVSEEAGMKWLAEWLEPKVQGITVTHIASGDPFQWV